MSFQKTAFQNNGFQILIPQLQAVYHLADWTHPWIWWVRTPGQFYPPPPPSTSKLLQTYFVNNTTRLMNRRGG